jgi:hypothetical protein
MPKKPAKPVKYKVCRGVWRTAEETRALLGLPEGYPLGRQVCKMHAPQLLYLRKMLLDRTPDEGPQLPIPINRNGN